MYDISKNQEGHHLKPLVEKVNNSPQKNSNDFWQLLRDLSSMAYLDIGGKTGETVVKVAPPMLVELPFFQPVFLLTGARSPEYLKIIKKSAKKSKIEIEVKTHSQIPYTLLIKPDSKVTLQAFLEDTSFQGNKLSDYIRVSENPTAWSILEFAGSLADYEQSLTDNGSSGDKLHIKEIFNIDSLKFEPFDPNKDNLKDDFSLVKMFHQEHFYKYYLFMKENEGITEVQRDWGRFLVMAKYARNYILEYNKKTFELTSFLPLPFLLERGLALLSGNPPTVLENSSIKYKRIVNKPTFSKHFQNALTPPKLKVKSKNNKKAFSFKNVPYKIALLVAKKLKQNLKEI